MRMALSEQIDRDAACEIQITLASIADQIGALTANRTHPAPGIDGHQRRDRHGTAPFQGTKGKRRPQSGPPLFGPLLYCRGESRVNKIGSATWRGRRCQYV